MPRLMLLARLRRFGHQLYTLGRFARSRGRVLPCRAITLSQGWRTLVVSCDCYTAWPPDDATTARALEAAGIRR